ncbi:MAG TPA: 4-hydroxythreonine-4-phosphate dehydrogenase PdxA [Caulobacteraceae bacterium]|nr:4-hydroxythreonine-4-phosphate dehydrogenase PdxA [Caulobacteraceae bacterium]
MSLAQPIALSLGDPAGIGPEIILKAWRTLKGSGPVFVAVGDFATLARAAGADAEIAAVSSVAEVARIFPHALPVIDMPLAASVVPGEPSSAVAAAIIGWIEAGARLAMAGEAAALVTAPIAKAPLYEAGFAFPGHTEFLGALAPGPGAARPVMMLVARDLRCALATIHEPLARVSGLLTADAIVAAGRITAAALSVDFAIPRPRLAVAALNPHAGEAGEIGEEEETIIAPAVHALQAEGVAASGPHPADSLFHEAARASYDAVLCMYHDQALIPVKMLDFWGGVNVTLGLSIVRTSPDHGVAFDIAGRGMARPDSLIASLRLASDIAARRGAG